MPASIYIAIEGLDGSGKSTLFENIKNELQNLNIKYSEACPTKSSGEANLIEKIYESGSWFRKNRIIRALLYAYRHYKVGRDTNWQSGVIVGDRSIITTYVTYWSGIKNRNVFVTFYVKLLESFVRAPDYVLYLQLSQSDLRTRLKTRGIDLTIDETPERSEEMRIAYSEVKTSPYINTLKNTTWFEIDAGNSKAEVTEKAMNLIQNILSLSLIK